MKRLFDVSFTASVQIAAPEASKMDTPDSIQEYINKLHTDGKLFGPMATWWKDSELGSRFQASKVVKYLSVEFNTPYSAVYTYRKSVDNIKLPMIFGQDVRPPFVVLGKESIGKDLGEIACFEVTFDFGKITEEEVSFIKQSIQRTTDRCNSLNIEDTVTMGKFTISSVGCLAGLHTFYPTIPPIVVTTGTQKNPRSDSESNSLAVVYQCSECGTVKLTPM